MRLLAISLSLLFLFGCATTKQSPQPAPPPQPVAQEIKPLQVSPYERVATALLQPGEQKEPVEGFLKYVDQPTTTKIVSGAFQSFFDEKEAGQLAEFFESSAGKWGTKLFGKWLLTGQFLKGQMPVENDSTWENFQSTATGIKLFAQASSIYNKIAIDLVKVGGAMVMKAITADIGKEAAKGILKSGVVFLR